MPDNFQEELNRRQGLLLLTFCSPEDLEHYICYASDHADQAIELKGLIEEAPSEPDEWISINTRIGKLLGYEKEDISHYI